MEEDGAFPSLGRYRLAAGSVLVVASMVTMFEVPPEYFIAVAFVSTACMALVGVSMGGYRGLFRPSPASLAIGLASAVALYLIFVGGSFAISLFHPLGITTTSENTIYALIASPASPRHIQVLVLFFDAVGYESFFRGVVQRRAQRLRGGAPFAAALADSAVHVLTMNPLWVVTTFIVDAGWGLTYRYANDLTSSMTSHFVWDMLIFVLFPIH